MATESDAPGMHRTFETLIASNNVPEGGLGDATFLTDVAPAACSDFAGQVGNILGSMALGSSKK